MIYPFKEDMPLHIWFLMRLVLMPLKWTATGCCCTAHPVQQLEINKTGTGSDLILDLLFEEGPREYLPFLLNHVLQQCSLGGHDQAGIFIFYILGPILHQILPSKFHQLQQIVAVLPRGQRTPSGFLTSYTTATLQRLFLRLRQKR